MSSKNKRERKGREDRKRKSKTRKGKAFKGESMQVAPVTMGYKNLTLAPSVKERGMGKNRTVRVKHRELFLGTVNGSIAWTLQSKVQLNPGLPSVFPWLSSLADLYDQYRVHALSFEYIPSTSTATNGDIIMSIDYDVTDPAPTSELNTSQMEGTIQDACWKRIVLNADVKAMQPESRKYVRRFNVAGDQRIYDLGRFYLSTINMAAATAVGKIWINYDVEFFVPDPGTETISPLITNEYYLANQVCVNGVATTLAFTINVFLNDPLNIGSAVAGLFTPPSGVYRVTYTGYALDSISEDFTAQIYLYKNGAAQDNWRGSGLTIVGPVRVLLNFSELLVVNTGDTFQIVAILSGAAGALSVINSVLLLSMA